jgi:hypothetical protein
MSPIATRAEVPRRPRTLPFEWRWIAALAGAVVLLFVAMPLVRGGHFVAQVRVVNPSPYDMEVAVASSPSDGWMPITTAINRHTSSAPEVYDIGDRWTFRFSTPDATAEITLSRAELERNHWTVRVPSTFVDELQSRGAIQNPEVNVG